MTKKFWKPYFYKGYQNIIKKKLAYRNLSKLEDIVNACMELEEIEILDSDRTQQQVNTVGLAEMDIFKREIEGRVEKMGEKLHESLKDVIQSSLNPQGFQALTAHPNTGYSDWYGGYNQSNNWNGNRKQITDRMARGGQEPMGQTISKHDRGREDHNIVNRQGGSQMFHSDTSDRYRNSGVGVANDRTVFRSTLNDSTCYFCGKRGHFKRDCWEFTRWLEEKRGLGNDSQRRSMGEEGKGHHNAGRGQDQCKVITTVNKVQEAGESSNRIGIKRDNKNWKMGHSNICTELEDRKPSVVIFGDSLVERLRNYDGRLSGVWKESDINNAGLSGDKIENVLYRIQETDFPTSVNKVLLAVGTNNQ